ncbi:hypothetical protein Ancab_035811, partial [Ancistrocladus abbreviatus]
VKHMASKRERGRSNKALSFPTSSSSEHESNHDERTPSPSSIATEIELQEQNVRQEKRTKRTNDPHATSITTVQPQICATWTTNV